MDRVPNELLLHIFEDFSFNELQTVLATCSCWRALWERCHGFWLHIQTPASSITRTSALPKPTVASELALRRIERTGGRAFTLCLRGLYPGFLDAVVQRAHQITHLHVEFLLQWEMDDFSAAMRTVSVPKLRKLTLHSTAFPTSKPLPANLFAGAAYPALTSLCLRNVDMPATGRFPCFSAVTSLQYWPTEDFFEPIPQDLFAHFPAIRALSLGGKVYGLKHAFTDDEVTAMRRFMAADYTVLDRLELVDDCYTLAEQAGWPLDNVTHVAIDNSSACRTFPFLPYGRLKRAHLVFETVGNCAWVRVGNDDWTFSRSCAIDKWDAGTGMVEDDSYNPICGFYVNDGALDSTKVQTVTVAAVLWPRCGRILDDVYNLTTIRIVLSGDVLPTFGRTLAGRIRRLAVPSLDRLVFRGEAASGPVRISYAAVTKFASEQFQGVVCRSRLCLENVELLGESDYDFEMYFKAVEKWDAGSWSYLFMRKSEPSQHI